MSTSKEQLLEDLSPEEQTERVLQAIARERRYHRERWSNKHDDRHEHEVIPGLMMDRLSEIRDMDPTEARNFARMDELFLEVAALAVAAIEQQERASMNTLALYEDLRVLSDE